jgi:hypothetical protein
MFRFKPFRGTVKSNRTIRIYYTMNAHGWSTLVRSQVRTFVEMIPPNIYEHSGVPKVMSAKYGPKEMQRVNRGPAGYSRNRGE